MTVVSVRHTYLALATLVALVITGCEQVENLTSGGGGREKTTPTESASGTNADVGKADEAKDEGADGDTAAKGPNASTDDAPDKKDLEPPDDAIAGAGVEEDPGDDDSKPDESSNPYAHRNVEQYPRLPSNVTWKPISSSSGDNLTIILWGRGGGEKNYEKGTLRIEYNGGVKYPVKEGPRHDGAPRFLFDVQGGWFKDKDPVLFWNLGTYRIVHPERRQGKNEE